MKPLHFSLSSAEEDMLHEPNGNVSKRINEIRSGRAQPRKAWRRPRPLRLLGPPSRELSFSQPGKGHWSHNQHMQQRADMPASTGVLSGFITSALVRVDHVMGNKPATTVDTVMIFGRKRKLTVLRSTASWACGRRNERLDRGRIIARTETTPE